MDPTFTCTVLCMCVSAFINLRTDFTYRQMKRTTLLLHLYLTTMNLVFLGGGGGRVSKSSHKNSKSAKAMLDE